MGLAEIRPYQSGTVQIHSLNNILVKKFIAMQLNYNKMETAWRSDNMTRFEYAYCACPVATAPIIQC
jgi:hypothetical protein